MKMMALLLALTAVLAMFGLTPFQGEDISRLKPVELLVVAPAEDGISLRTEGGIAAWGKDLPSAMEQLKAAAPGKLFLATVDHVVLTGQRFSPEELLSCGLRPGAAVYLSPAVEDVDALKKYLGSKEGGVTLGKLREEDADVPTLVVGKSGLYLPPQ